MVVPTFVRTVKYIYILIQNPLSPLQIKSTLKFPLPSPSVEVIIEGVDLLDNVKKYEARDDEVVKAIEEMKCTGIKMLRDEE